MEEIEYKNKFIDMVQELGKSGRSDLVDWFGDMLLYEKKGQCNRYSDNQCL